MSAPGKKWIVIAVILVIIAVLADLTTDYGTAEQVRYSSSGHQVIQWWRGLFDG